MNNKNFEKNGYFFFQFVSSLIKNFQPLGDIPLREFVHIFTGLLQQVQDRSMDLTMIVLTPS